MASDTRAPKTNEGKVREKVALKPGFHLTDWMRLQQSMTKPTPSPNISPSELAKHNSEYDMWTAYQGKVYNITNYVAYHPGGASILKKGAGKDCTDLFNKYHRWVNIESILAKCYIGILGSEIKAIREDDEDGEEEDYVREEKERKNDDAYSESKRIDRKEESEENIRDLAIEKLRLDEEK
jgi:cytochrome b involved in lipid metabolism